MSAAHTPTPWHVWTDDSGGEFTGWPSVSAAEELDTTVVHRAGFKQEYWGDLSLRETLANAEFIVRAVNAHDDLVGALRLFEAQWNACGPNSDFGRHFSNVRDAARKALAKVETQS